MFYRAGQPDLYALDLKDESFSTKHPSVLKSYLKGRVLQWVKSLTVDAHDTQDPVITKKALFPDMVTFRKAI